MPCTIQTTQSAANTDIKHAADSAAHTEQAPAERGSELKEPSVITRSHHV